MADTHVPFVAGRFGRAADTPGLCVAELTHVALAHVVARRGRAAAASAATRRAFGCELPDSPRSCAGSDTTFLWSGGGQWLALAAAQDRDIETRLGTALADSVSVFDQGGSRVLLELTGPRCRDVLTKGCPLDLDPGVFAPGASAPTPISHFNCQLWHVDGAPRYRVLAVRSYFDSFWRWLANSAVEYGAEVLPPRRYMHASAAAAAATPAG